MWSFHCLCSVRSFIILQREAVASLCTARVSSKPVVIFVSGDLHKNQPPQESKTLLPNPALMVGFTTAQAADLFERRSTSGKRPASPAQGTLTDCQHETPASTRLTSQHKLNQSHRIKLAQVIMSWLKGALPTMYCLMRCYLCVVKSAQNIKTDPTLHIQEDHL